MTAVSNIAQRHVVNRLRLAGATKAAAAQPLPGLRPLQARHLQRLLDAGVIRREGADRYWVDEDKWAEFRRLRRMLGLTFSAAVIVIMALVLWLTRR